MRKLSSGLNWMIVVNVYITYHSTILEMYGEVCA